MKKENTKRLFNYFASCPRNLEQLLLDEINEFDFAEVEESRGGVKFKSDDQTALDFLLSTRIASRVFKQMHFFKMNDENDIYDRAMEKWWHRIFDLEQTFKVNTLLDLHASRNFSNTMILSQKLKDGIVDQFRKETNDRPSVDTKFPDITFLLRIDSRKTCNGYTGTVYADLCGEPLSHRGYRTPGHKAPLRENLAAGIVLSTDFNPDQDIFVDPMCGSGTLLIESVLIKGNILPSYLKVRKIIERRETPFAVMNHTWFKQDKMVNEFFKKRCQDIYNDTLEKLNELPTHQFYGFDNSQSTLEITKDNIHMAKLPADVIVLERADATRVIAPEEAPGVVITNPPFGARLGQDDDLEELYHQLGENLKSNFKNFRAYIFTSEPELRKKISLQTSKRTTFYNGSIECRLLRYELR
jgi:23S rRNA G2445 N2-methylase RlmL